MADLLEERYGFAAENLRLLLDEDATRDGILEALDGLAERSGQGDLVVIHFSGHGSQVLDRDGDEPDGLDETLVPYDARRHGVGPDMDITDHELHTRLARFDDQGTLVTLILDCCHAGHVHRSHPGLRIRQLPPIEKRTRALGTNVARSKTTVGWRRQPRGRIVLAACQDDQLAGERCAAGGHAFGEWTWALLRVLSQAPPAMTAREAFERSAALCISANPDQWPQIHGDLDRQIFGGERIRSSRFLLARKARAGLWRLSAGLAQGLIPGACWRLVRQGASELRRSDFWAEGTLARVGPLESELRIAGPVAPVPDDEDTAWAFEHEPAYGDSRLPVVLDAAEDWRQSSWAHWVSRIDTSPVLRRLEKNPPTDFFEAVAIGSDLSLTDGRGSPLAGDSGDPVDLPEAIIPRLERRARARHGLRLINLDSSSALTGVLDVSLYRQRFADSWEPAACTAGAADFEIGDRLGIELCHRHVGGLYIYIFDFGLTDRVTQLFPEYGGAEYLFPDRELRLGLLAGDELELAFPSGFDRNVGVGFIKVFATTHPSDFVWITTDSPWPSMSRRRSSLENLLAMRGISAPRVRGGGDWTTCRQAIRLRQPDAVSARASSAD